MPIFPSSRRNASTAGVKEFVKDQGVLRVGIRFGGEVAIEFLQLAGFRKRSHPGKIHVENIWWLSGRHHGLQLREVLAAVSGIDAKASP